MGAASVLLVEDDLFFSARLLAALERMGCTPVPAASAEEALARAAEQRPMLAVVNLASTRIDGLGLVRRLKGEAGVSRVLAYLPHVRIRAMRDSARAAGVDGLYPNSAVMSRLPDLVARVLAGAPDDADA